MLHHAIVSGRLQPNQRLIEADLVEQLGVGRAAIRTALDPPRAGAPRRTRAEPRSPGQHGLPAPGDRDPPGARGTGGPDGEQRRRAHHAEGAAALRADLAAQRKQLDRGDLLAASDANAAFHRRIIAIARHETAERLISSLHAQMVRFQYRTILAPGRSESSFAEHLAIADAIAAGNPRAAEQAMRKHIAKVAAALKSLPFEGGVTVR